MSTATTTQFDSSAALANLPVAVEVPLTEERFAHAYRQGFGRTVRFLQSTGVQLEMAEEIAQAAWTRGWECRSQLKNPAALGVWVNSIAKNLLRVDFRRRRAVEELQENSAVMEASTDGTALSELLSMCSKDDRDLLVRHYMEGWSSNELAPQLGISPVSVRVRLLRIKAALRDTMQVRGYVVPLGEAA